MEGMLRRWHGPVYSEDDPREKRFMTSIEKIKSIVGKVIQRVLDDRKKEQSGGDLGDRPYLLIDTIVDTAKEYDDPSMPKKQEIIIADAISFFIGGFHTTSNCNYLHRFLNDLSLMRCQYFSADVVPVLPGEIP